jgi:Ser/Thr protein kinase RdoA (MazF antagonist)
MQPTDLSPVLHLQHPFQDQGRGGQLSRIPTGSLFRKRRQHPGLDAPRSVIHGDFAPWNLLFDDGRLTGLLDFEATHHTFQVADFALSWRGYQDDVLRGYDEVRPLSDVEWHLVQPVYQAWLFLGLKDALAAHYSAPDHAGEPLNLEWQSLHARRQSPLIARKTGAVQS